MYCCIMQSLNQFEFEEAIFLAVIHGDHGDAMNHGSYHYHQKSLNIFAALICT